MQRLIAHRKETGSFDGDIDEFCNAIIRNMLRCVREFSRLRLHFGTGEP